MRARSDRETHRPVNTVAIVSRPREARRIGNYRAPHQTVHGSAKPAEVDEPTCSNREAEPSFPHDRPLGAGCRSCNSPRSLSTSVSSSSAL